jgi:hypothetical protein
MLRFVKVGDWGVLLLASIGVAWLAATLWRPSAGDTLIVRTRGSVFSEIDLRRDRKVSVPGRLGVSIVEISKRRARIAADPSPRQYCVKQGWLERAGEIALCLPNQVSIEIAGGVKRYDSLNY